MREIAELAVEVLGLRDAPSSHFAGGDRGWKGDVPVVRINTDRIRAPGLGQRHVVTPGAGASLRSHRWCDARSGRLTMTAACAPPAGAVFLDRDGVLNEAVVRDGTPLPPASPDEVVVPRAWPRPVRRLRAAAWSSSW